MSRKRLQETAGRLLLVASMVCLLCGADWADGGETWEFDIPRQNVDTALTTLAQQTGTQLLFPYDEVTSHEANPLTGRYTLDEALEILLRDTGLTGDVTDSGVITISLETSTNSRDQGDDMGREKKKGILAGVAAAVLSVLGGQDAAGQEAGEGDATRGLMPIEEIIVTAQKRSERLQDVPVPVTAISAATLVNTNQLRLQDYSTRIPGLNVTPNSLRGVPILTIRGLTTGGATIPTVGITVDDVPYGSATALGGGYTAPDIDPSDLERIEVLRGPQGTLYGASSIGGLLKFVTVDPSTDTLSGRVQAGMNSVYKGDNPGHNFRAAVNVPLSDTWAVRASAFTRRDPGYIDDPVLGIDDVNQGDAHGGRLAALWNPSEALALKLSALRQDLSSDGMDTVHVQPGLSDLEHGELRGTGWFEKQFEAYSANLTATLGNVDLTFVSGYNIDTRSATYDLTPQLGFLSQQFFGMPGSAQVPEIKAEKFTQEIRLLAPIAPRVNWLFGVFYSDESTRSGSDIFAADPTTGTLAGQVLLQGSSTTYEEYAAFTNLTLQVTDRFDLQIGGRESRNKQTVSNIAGGALRGGVTTVIDVNSEDSAFTYLLTPRFKISPDMMVYARLASGYRPGGPNTNLAFGSPPTFGPDTTKNYEIGVKGSLLDQTFSFDASIYYIDWEDIQVNLRNPGNLASYVGNVGRAKSQGVEVSIEARPLSGLTLATWVAYNDAVLTEAFPPTSPNYGAAGDRLPSSSRLSANLSFDHEFSLTSTVIGSMGGSVSYVGDRVGVFMTSPQRQVFPAYTKVDLRAGATYESWAFNFFVNNVADRRAAVGGGLGEWVPYIFSYIQPRTIGMSLEKSF